MQKNHTWFFILLLLIGSVLIFAGRYLRPHFQAVINSLTAQKSFSDSKYVGSSYNGNFVWGGAMNLAWSEMNESVLKDKAQFQTQDPSVVSFVSKFNNPPITKADLDTQSYYIKSGYGQSTIEAINRESREKFPTKSFGDLSFQLMPRDFITYAYFLKEVEYQTEFTKADVTFQAIPVEGLRAEKQNQKKTVQIVKYWNDDKFILSLSLKNDKDQLLLIKGFPMSNPSQVVQELNSNLTNNYQSMDNNDEFEMPNLQLDLQRNYTEVVGIPFSNPQFTKYSIQVMQEKIKFDLDNTGARVENEGLIMVEFGAILNPEPQQHKRLILDKPFWVIMKQSNSTNPYFILGVNNTEVMSLVK